MTFSLVGRDGATGALGIAVTSSSPAVAARCAHVRPGAGAAASQNVTDPRLGRRLLDLLEAGASAGEALSRTVADAGPFAEHRQLAAVDAEGSTAVFSGGRTLGRHAEARGRGCAAAATCWRRRMCPMRWSQPSRHPRELRWESGWWPR